MRKFFSLFAFLLILSFGAVEASAQIPFFKKNSKKYNLGSVPQVGLSYQFPDDLGGFTVKGYDPQTEELVLSFFSGKVKIEADDTSTVSRTLCAPPDDYTLSPSDSCALKGLNVEKKREYHLSVSWRYEVKKKIRVVIVEVKKAVIKLS